MAPPCCVSEGKEQIMNEPPQGLNDDAVARFSIHLRILFDVNRKCAHMCEVLAFGCEMV